MMRRTLLLLIVLSSLGPGAARADGVDDLINALKPSPLDYAAWAERLAKAAAGLSGRPQAQVRVYRTAYERGLRTVEGYPAAIKAARALRGLLKPQPREALRWEDRLLDALRRDWGAARGGKKKQKAEAYVTEIVVAGDRAVASGDLRRAAELYGDATRKAKYYAPGLLPEAERKLKEIQERQRVQKEIERLKALLAANPKKLPVREKLIRLYVVERDSMAEADKLLTPEVCEELRTYVPLAARRTEESAKEVCQELGDWYARLAHGGGMVGWRVTLTGKVNSLTRAKACYERFVKLETDPVKRGIGKAKLTKVGKELATIGLGDPASGITLDLGNGVTMRLLRIRAGKFVMGSAKAEAGRKEDEGPQHWVKISKPFYMGVTEVTQTEYQAVMGANPNRFEGGNRPVEQVSWEDAMRFCAKLSEKTQRKVRLPTEAEWEYACRAGTKTRYSFGNSESDLVAYAWLDRNSEKQTHEVAKKKPNAWGLYDMHGNVWEWCADWYGGSYYRSSPGSDPKGPGSGKSRVLRGGSWLNAPQGCRAAVRLRYTPDARFSRGGFRVVVSAGVD